MAGGGTLGGVAVREHLDLPVAVAVRQRIAEQVGQHLADAAVIGLHGRLQLVAPHDGPPGMRGAHLRQHLLQLRQQRGLIAQRHREATAEPATREVEQVLDQLLHAHGAAAHPQQVFAEVAAHRRRVEIGVLEHVHAKAQRMQGSAQVVPQHGDELLAQARDLVRGQKLAATVRNSLLGLEVRRHQLRVQLQAAQQGGIVQLGRLRVDCAQRAEERTVRAEDRDRDVALEAIHLRGWMVCPRRIGACVAEDPPRTSRDRPRRVANCFPCGSAGGS